MTPVERVRTTQFLAHNVGREDRKRMGIGLHNLWVRPDVQVLGDDALDEANRRRRVTLKIDGLLGGL